MVKVLVGDLFESDASTIVNTVNCVGVMGKGIAAVFKKRYPDNFKDYKSRCEQGLVKPGKPYLYRPLFGRSILNFPTKDHWRSSSRLSYVENGLNWFIENWERLGIESIAFPPLGCGNGGLEWADVGPLMYQKLKGLPIAIEIYAPFGTPQRELSAEFLARTPTSSSMVGKPLGVYNKAWDLILYVIDALNRDPYALSVGRTVYQKICYVLTRLNVQMGFAFSKGSYGPYSEEAKRALVAIANRNYIKEDVVGKMIKLTVSSEFSFDPKAFSKQALRAADCVIDLFSRFRRTEQAENCATLLYACDQLYSNAKRQTSVSEDEVLAYVINWKPHWGNDRKTKELKKELFYLSALRWVHVEGLTFVPEDVF